MVFYQFFYSLLQVVKLYTQTPLSKWPISVFGSKWRVSRLNYIRNTDSHASMYRIKIASGVQIPVLQIIGFSIVLEIQISVFQDIGFNIVSEVLIPVLQGIRFSICIRNADIRASGYRIYHCIRSTDTRASGCQILHYIR